MFADPSVEFGLQFTRASAPGPDAVNSELTPEGPAEAATPAPAQLPAMAGKEEASEAAEQGEGEAADKIVTLDRFRKK